MFCTECGQSVSESQKFCGSCGNKIIQSSSQEDTHSADNEFSHYAHAYNSAFGTKFGSVGDITKYAEKFADEIMKSANEGDPDALLKVAIIYCTDGARFEDAHKVAKRALEIATKQNLDLGRYFFGYGFALEQIENFDEATDAYEESVALNFSEAYFNLGRMNLINQLDLFNAIRIWKIGRDKFNNETCAEMIQDLQVGDGIYSASVPRSDGSVEILTVSDKPGGLGQFK